MIKTCSPACVSKAFSGYQILSSNHIGTIFPKAPRRGSSSKRLLCTHHSTYNAHIHHTTALTSLAYTAPQHIHHSHTPHHSTYTAHIHHTTALTSPAYTTPRHIHRSHTPHHSTYIACLHQTPQSTPTALTHAAPQHLHSSPTPHHCIYTARLHTTAPLLFFSCF